MSYHFDAKTSVKNEFLETKYAWTIKS